MSTCTQKPKIQIQKIPKASEIQEKSGTLGKLPKELVEKIGNPKLAIAIDLETHGWLDNPSKKGHIGQFGHYTMKDDESLRFARIVQIAWVIGECRNNSEVKSKCIIVKPNGFQVESKATKFHGISHEMASVQGATLEHVLSEFMTDVTNAHKDGGIVVAHQLEFDAGVIYEELGRCGLIKLRNEWSMLARKGFCTMCPRVGRWLLQGCNEDVGPDTVQHALGLRRVANILVPERVEGKQHDAECDAKLCHAIFLTIAERARDENDS